MPGYVDRLHTQLSDAFDTEELKTLCFGLSVDYENLPAAGKANKARELIAHLIRRRALAQLVILCRSERPQLPWGARIFLSYKRHAKRDQGLADYLNDHLTQAGHEVFIDRSMRAGTAWLEEIDRQIQRSDYLVVLISPESADSEMVQAEIRRAHSYGRRQGHPAILPVRVAYEGLLPYAIDAFLDPLQYIVWTDAAGDEKAAAELLSAVEGHLPHRKAAVVAPEAKTLTLSEDGRLLVGASAEGPPVPLPEFDPRFLEMLPVPGGAVRLSDTLYVERDADMALRRQLSRLGTITTIRAPRQTGKSSLLVRGVHHAGQQGAQVVNLDMQRVDRDCLASSDAFLRYLADYIGRRLRIDQGEIDQAWQGALGSQDKLTYFMEDLVLQGVDRALVLAIDEADRLLETNFHNDIFGLVRAWHNSAAYDLLWERLNLVLVISTEPYLLIADPNQSPFNVGLKLNLEDFEEEQVRLLNERHGSPVNARDFPSFLELTGGHPYLTRKALYTLTTDRLSWTEFLASAATDQGPFGDHLRRLLWLLRDEPELQAGLKTVVHRARCDDQEVRYRLLRAGLIKETGDDCTCRCDLYRQYFREKM